MADVTAKLILDASGVTAGISSAQRAMSKFSSSIGAVGVMAAAGLAAATAAVTALAIGIKSAIDLGDQLDELSARTGVAAGELRILQQAFDRAGIGAEKVGPAINKAQKAIADASNGSKEAADKLAQIGLSASDLAGMSPDKQFQAIGAAIAGIQDPAQQAAAAIAIFGKSGGEMLALFRDSGAMGDAAKSVGSQAELLTKNATIFGRAGDILSTIGTKLQGFWVGVADKVVPAIMPILEYLDSLDLAGIGQKLGDGIAFAFTAITSGKLGDILAAQFKLSGAQLINMLVQGFSYMAGYVGQRFIDIPKDFVTLLSVVTKADFWEGVGFGLLGAAEKFASAIWGAIAKLLGALAEFTGSDRIQKIADSYKTWADKADEAAQANFAKSGDKLAGPLATVLGQLEQSQANATKAAADAMAQAGETIATDELTKTRDQIAAEIRAQQQRNEAAARDGYGPKATLPNGEDGADAATKDKSRIGPLFASSLAKIGGGGGVAGAQSLLDETRRQTNYLRQIALSLKNIPAYGLA